MRVDFDWSNWLGKSLSPGPQWRKGARRQMTFQTQLSTTFTMQARFNRWFNSCHYMLVYNKVFIRKETIISFHFRQFPCQRWSQSGKFPVRGSQSQALGRGETVRGAGASRPRFPPCGLQQVLYLDAFAYGIAEAFFEPEPYGTRLGRGRLLPLAPVCKKVRLNSINFAQLRDSLTQRALKATHDN